MEEDKLKKGMSNVHLLSNKSAPSMPSTWTVRDIKALNFDDSKPNKNASLIATPSRKEHRRDVKSEQDLIYVDMLLTVSPYLNSYIVINI